MKKLIALLLMVSFVLLLGCGKTVTKEEQEKIFNQSITSLKEYSLSEKELTNIINDLEKVSASDYPDVFVIRDFAEARLEEEKGHTKIAVEQYKAVKAKLAVIPDDYTGTLAKEIAKYKASINRDYESAKEMLDAVNKEVQEERNHTIYVGDPVGKVEVVYGQPEEINQTQFGNINRLQYVYPDAYIYIEDNTVIAIQSRVK